MDKLNALLDVPLQASLARLEELLLVRTDFTEYVGRLLGTRGLERFQFPLHGGGKGACNVHQAQQAQRSSRRQSPWQSHRHPRHQEDRRR